jgi:hypothetical protein
MSNNNLGKESMFNDIVPVSAAIASQHALPRTTRTYLMEVIGTELGEATTLGYQVQPTSPLPLSRLSGEQFA